jgi:hypothetical protein
VGLKQKEWMTRIRQLMLEIWVIVKHSISNVQQVERVMLG